MSVEIVLHRRNGAIAGVAIVDDEDAAVAVGSWCLSTRGYAVRRGDDGRLVFLHRVLLGLEPGNPRQGDHEDRDKLNCRRRNLRVLEPGCNQQNVGSNQGSTSEHRGVSWDAQTGRWRASARGRTLGRFAREEDADAAARAARSADMPFAVDG